MSNLTRDSGPDPASAPVPAGLLTVATNWLGAIVSVSLIAGLVVWGVRLSYRDVADVPVIRAMEGPARIQPDDPGGTQADHQGLAVNSVQSDGQVEEPSDRIVLAPEPLDLADEDQPQGILRPVARSDDLNISAAAVPTDEPVTSDPADLVEDITAALDPALSEDPATDAVTETTVEVTPQPGASARRPKPRPTVASPEDVAFTVQTDAVEIDVDPAEILAGTRLVQLGAFDDETAAKQEWDKIVERHGDLLGPRKRLIQKAESGGRTFFRLRVVGFDDLSDSRRLCSALLARGTPCIPVTAR